MSTLALVAFVAAQAASAVSTPAPIIDMHMHAYKLSEFGPEPPKLCVDPHNMTVEGRDPSKPLDVAALFGNCGKPPRADTGRDETPEHCGGNVRPD
jgi:hypothetical protein